MKKLLFAFAAMLMLVVASCGQKADYAAINTKIEKGQSLSKSDYSAIIDYLVDANKELAKFKIDELDFSKIEQLVKKYPYLQTFMMALQNADEGMISSSDMKKLEAMQADIEKQWENL